MLFENPDLCQRCGVEDPDCRTLWHAAMYQLDESKKVPYVPVQVRGTVHPQDGFELLPLLKHKVPKFAETPTSPDWKNNFFLLRVCKTCRADWIVALQTWFVNERTPRVTVGTGIFVRENGVNVEITQEEWEARYKEKNG